MDWGNQPQKGGEVDMPTSKKVASAAGSVLRNPKATPKERAAAGAALAERKGARKLSKRNVDKRLSRRA